MNNDETAAQKEQIDALCERFRRDWLAGSRPDIAVVLGEIDPVGHGELLEQLLRLDMHFRAEVGERLAPATYKQRFPAWSQLIDATFEDTARDCAASAIGSGDAETLPPSVPDSHTPGANDVTMPLEAKAEEGAAHSAPADGRSSPEFVEGSPTGSARIFGDYELLDEIARGGMGVVYKARQTSLNRIVALKMILSGQLAGQDEVLRFRTEAEAAAQLDHPGIVPIYEVGEQEGQPYFSMGFVDGSSLSDLIAQRPLPPREAAHLTLKTAEAIQYAHEHGVIHRDLKPANVLVANPVDAAAKSSLSSSTALSQTSASSFSPRVTDFGLAKQVQGDDQLTATGQILGTPSYMPPEQAAGRIDQIDERSDVYSLGGILYALLTGRPPLQAASHLDTLMQVLEKDPVPPRQLDPKLPRDLETIALKALEKEPHRRYASAADLAADLGRFLQGEPILARSVSTVERAWRWTKRNPFIASLSTAVACLLLFVAIAGPLAAWQQSILRGQAEQNEAEATRLAQQEADARVAAEQARRLEQQQREKAEDLAEANRQQLVRMNVGRGDALLARGDPAAAMVWYTEAFRLDDQPQQQAQHRLRLTSLWQHLPKFTHLWRHAASITHIALSADDRWAATTSDDGMARVWDLKTGKPVTPPLKHDHSVWCCSFSADGQQLVTGSGALGVNGELQIWDIATGELLGTPVRSASSTFFYVKFTDSGDFLSAEVPFSGKAVARLHSKATFKEIGSGRFDPFGPFYKHVAHFIDAPRGRLFQTEGPTGRVIDLTAGGNVVCELQHDTKIQYGCFNNDGTRVFTAEKAKLHMWEVETGKHLASYEGQPGGWKQGFTTKLEARFSLDSQRVTVSSESGKVFQFVADQRQIDHASVIPEVRLARAVTSHDGRFAASLEQDGTARIWDVRSERMLAPPLKHTGTVNFATFTRNSRQMITACADGTARVWDLSVVGLPAMTIGHGRAVHSAEFSSDGKQVITTGKMWVQRWNAESGAPLGKTFFPSVPSIAGEVHVGTGQFAGGSNKSTAQVWNYITGEVVPPVIQLDKQFVRALRFSPNGKLLGTVVVDGLAEPARHLGVAHIWKIDTGECVAGPLRFKGLLSGIQVPEFSPAGRFFAIGGASATLTGIEPKLKVFNLGTGEELQQQFTHASGYAVHHMEFDQQDRYLVSVANKPDTGGGQLRIWDLESGQPVGEPHLYPAAVTDVVIDPHSRSVAAAVADQVHLIELTTGDVIQSPLMHADLIGRIKFTPSGDFLLTSTRENTIHIWNVVTGRGMIPPVRHPDIITDVVATADGRLLTACADGVVRMWHLGGDDRSPDEFLRMSRLVSAQQVSTTRGAPVSAAATVDEDWHYLQQKFPGDFSASNIQIVWWHQQQAKLCEKQHDWKTAIVHRQHVLQQRPKHLGTRHTLGQLFCELGEFGKGAEQFARLTELAPKNHWYRYITASAHLRSGNLAAYRAVCQAYLADFSDSNDPGIVLNLSKICLMGPNDFAEESLPRKLAARAMAHEPGHSQSGWIRLSQALAHYRAEDYEQAAELLRRLKDEPDQADRVPSSMFLLAMTQWQLGQSDRAKQTFADAVSYRKQTTIGPFVGAWLGNAHADIFEREAEQLITTKPIAH